ncbi:unnamed protein product [Echinostoma caproni]|uniref:Uncharacterized protein n=1 Tax=Echinostoma caproni TaxID=27848 RepID=A0A183A5V3_9TREM|nr:unnamed protein product [Echinostoma caproni]
MQTVGDGAELVFCTSDSSTAKRLAYQLNCARTYALGSEEVNATAVSPQQQQSHSGPFSRLSRQFRDT